MNTKINLTYNGVDYTLEYDRMIIKLLEENGFSITEFMKKPMSNVELAFAGSFQKNHRKTPQTTIDEIYKNCGDKNGLIQALITMIQECYDSLLSDNSEKEGNVTWEIVGSKPKTK